MVDESPYIHLEHDFLIDVYKQGPDRLRQALAGLDEETLRARPRLDKWSVQEIAIHMTDSEIVGAVRFRQAFAQPGATLPFYDQDVWTELMGYRSLNRAALDASLDLFAALRSTTALLLERVSDDDWSKTVFHPERGPLSLRDLLEVYADHSERHIGQIVGLRALLDQPIQMPLLLDERLY